MRYLRWFFRGITAINVNFMKGYRLLILVMMLCMLYEVFARYVFNAPTIWSYELTGMLVGPLWMFSAGYSMVRNEHIRLDLVYNRLSPRKQGIIDSITWLLFFFYIGSVMYYGWDAFCFALAKQSRSDSLWAPLLWPWRLTVPVACGLLLLQGIVVYANCLYKAITGRQLE